jgi:hypothetical protein
MRLELLISAMRKYHLDVGGTVVCPAKAEPELIVSGAV